MLITTSRNSGKRTINFTKELSNRFPNSVYASRGKKALEELIDKTRYLGKEKLLVIKEEHGNPCEMRLLKISEKDWKETKKIGVKLIKLGLEIGKEKYEIDLLGEKISNKKIKGLVKCIFDEFDDEADCKLREETGALSFFLSEKEIGPIFKIEEK